MHSFAPSFLVKKEIYIFGSLLLFTIARVSMVGLIADLITLVVMVFIA